MKTPAKIRGFPLIETLTPTTLVSVLAATVAPVAERGKETAKRSKCASNARQIALHLITKANQNPNQNFTTNSGGNWAWDVWYSVVSGLVSQTGRKVL